MDISLKLDEIPAFTSGEDPVQLYELIAAGVSPEDGRSLATWLEGRVEDLLDQLADRVRHIEDLSERLLAYESKATFPEAETFYHPNKPSAQALAYKLREDHRVKMAEPQYEPGNGYMVVVVPHLYDLSDLAHLAEIQDGTRRPKPKGRKPWTAAAQPENRPVGARTGGSPGASPGEAGKAPTKGATARVWEIADRVTAEKGGTIDRTAIIAACTAEGINPATAGTQYSKWKKTK